MTRTIIDQKWESLTQAYRVEFQATETWGIEVIKALFLLNGAGLTGVFALLANVSQDRSALPFGLFALGIIASVVSMVLGRYMHALAADGWLKHIENFRPTTNVKNDELPNLNIVQTLHCFSITTAFLSGGLCVWAGIKLYLFF